MTTVAAERLRPLFGLRVALAPGVEVATGADAVLVPRRGRLERWWAAWLHRGRTRVRLRLDERGRRVVAAIVAAGRPAVPELAARLEVTLPDVATPGHEWPPEAVSLLVFLETLARSRVIVTEPI